MSCKPDVPVCGRTLIPKVSHYTIWGFPKIRDPCFVSYSFFGIYEEPPCFWKLPFEAVL